jgi:hypothetical protein
MLFRLENYGHTADVMPNTLLLELAKVLLRSSGDADYDPAPADVVMVAVQLAKNPEITGIMSNDIRNLAKEIWLKEEAGMQLERRTDGIFYLTVHFADGSIKTGANPSEASATKTIASIAEVKKPN